MINLEEINKHYNAFWQGSFIDRCCLYITKPAHVPFKHENVNQKWEDISFRCKCAEYIKNNTVYYADAFPNVFADFGPGSLAEFVGGSFKWAEDTVWYDTEQFITDFENLPDIKLNKNSFIFNLAKRYISEILNIGGIIPSVPDIGGITDTIAALRGTQNLLFDLYDYPDEVMELNREMCGMWLETFKFFAELSLEKTGYITSWMPVLSDKPYYPLQCDFSAMISTDMFKKFIMPELEFATNSLPRTIYHLDGVAATQHLDDLLSLKNLNAIQWSPGSGQPDVGDNQWFEMYKRIQKAGKGVVLSYAPPEQVENILKNISPEGLFVCTVCEDEKQAKDFIRCAEIR